MADSKMKVVKRILLVDVNMDSKRHTQEKITKLSTGSILRHFFYLCSAMSRVDNRDASIVVSEIAHKENYFLYYVV